MSNFPIIKKRKDFLRAAKAETVIFHNVLLQAARILSDAGSKPARIGFTATKRLGKAHIRNRTKRRLRAVVREIYDKYALPDTDYVLVGRYDTFCCPFENLRTDVIRAFKKINKAFLAPAETISTVNESKSSDEKIADCTD
ncbi:MAG: ribonuclease P protein component [Alphaproteobacteria bacterium]|nr:ribonuclease P protein component [Alphaproteobacteria bacterium]